MRQNKSTSGFTLIEVIIIIAIMGIAIVLGLSLATSRAENFKIKSAAVQAQQLMQAGFTYQADNGGLPSGDTDKNMPSDFVQYSPVLKNNVNPWGNAYTFSGDSNGNFNITIITPSDSVAKKVASFLPNASLNGKQVNFYQKNTTLGSSFTIVGFGMTQSYSVTKDYSSYPTDLSAYASSCSQGKTLSAIPFLSEWNVDDAYWNAGGAAHVIDNNFYFEAFFDNGPPPMVRVSFDSFKHDHDDSRMYFHITISYLVICT